MVTANAPVMGKGNEGLMTAIGTNTNTTDTNDVKPAGVVVHDWGWRHASRKDYALRHVDFEIKPGERVLLLGASGAGKSTLMAGLAGVLGGDDEGEQEGRLAGRRRGCSFGAWNVRFGVAGPDAQTILGTCGGWMSRSDVRT